VRSPRPRRRFRWSVAVVALALLVGSGLGFGIGSSVTPSGSARANVAGLGFIPADGWRVTQTASIGDSGIARAVASNVPLAAGDEARDVPVATLRKLPAKGIVIVARFFPRGDPLRDARFPLRTLPLHVADAVPIGEPSWLNGPSLVSLRIRAGTEGYNIDARVFLGASPSPLMIADVDAQLRRLVISPGAITLVVQPRVISDWGQRMSIFGSSSSGRANEKVTIQFKACGLTPPQFRDVFETTTRSGGGFSLGEIGPFNLKVSGTYRAISGDSISAEVPVQQRAYVVLRAVRGGRFQAGVSGTLPFWRRQVVLQRYEPRRGIWVSVRRLVLTEQRGGAPGSAPPFQGVSTVFVETEPFRPAVPRRTMLRAVFPLAQARPCYLAGVSKSLRT
jgi:hypothetical protein